MYVSCHNLSDIIDYFLNSNTGNKQTKKKVTPLYNAKKGKRMYEEKVEKCILYI